jgi:ribokinase
VSDPIVLTVGSLHYDIMVEASHLPRKDETAVGTRWYPKFGGKGGNQAVACARQGAASRMVGAVGRDNFAPFLREGLAAAGVDHRFVVDCDAPSGMSVAIMDAAGDYMATIVSGANLMIDTDALRSPAAWADVALLILQNEIPDAVNQVAATEARARGIPVLLNAAPARALSPTFKALVDILVVNAVEAEMMGTDPVCCLQSADDAARKLAAQFDTVIVTAGAQGLAAWGTAFGAFQLPAVKVKAISSHGAGDAFIGAFAAGLVQKPDLFAACSAAALAASRHVAGQPAAA